MQQKSYKYVLVDKKDNVAVITMNRPDRLNALGGELHAEVQAAVIDADADPEIRVVVTTGAGDKAFSSGADLKDPTVHSTDKADDSGKTLPGKRWSSLDIDMLTAWGQWGMIDIKKPSIAAINGLCIGGGLEHALGCDIMLCSDNASFQLTQTNLGIIPGMACSHLARRVGKSWAMEMVLAGERMDAQEALRIGLVNHVVPLPELMPATMKLARSIASKAPLGIKLGKLAIDRALELPLTDAIQECGPLMMALFDTEDRKEASRAFLEKREPKFTGR